MRYYYLIGMLCASLGCSQGEKQALPDGNSANGLPDSITQEDIVHGDVIQALEFSAIFRIDLASFFKNSAGKNPITNVEDLMSFVPVSFIEDEERFFIPNRLNKSVVEFNRSGIEIKSLGIKGDNDITKFFIDKKKQELLLLDNGLIAFDFSGNEKYNRSGVIDYIISQNDSESDILLLKGNDEKLYYEDLKEANAQLHEVKSGSHFYNGSELFELVIPSDDSTYFTIDRRRLGDSTSSTKTYKISCASCFNRPYLIDENLIIAANYKTMQDELVVVGDNELTRYVLQKPKDFSPIGDIAFEPIMTNGFVYYLDQETSVLYAMGTDERQIIVIAYDTKALAY